MVENELEKNEKFILMYRCLLYPVYHCLLSANLILDIYTRKFKLAPGKSDSTSYNRKNKKREFDVSETSMPSIKMLLVPMKKPANSTAAIEL